MGIVVYHSFVLYGGQNTFYVCNNIFVNVVDFCMLEKCTLSSNKLRIRTKNCRCEDLICSGEDENITHTHTHRTKKHQGSLSVFCLESREREETTTTSTLEKRLVGVPSGQVEVYAFIPIETRPESGLEPCVMEDRRSEKDAALWGVGGVG